MNSRTSTKTRKRGILAILVLALGLMVGGGVFAAQMLGNSQYAFADDAPSWNTLPTQWIDGQRITFDPRMDWQNVTAGASEKMVRYESVWTAFTITLPTAEEVGQPQNYKDANGNPNYKLAGWAVAGKSDDGTAKQVRYFAPGEEVSIDYTFLNDNDEVVFLADWQPISYDFGSGSDTQLGGLKDNMVETDAIKTTLYDISASVYNQQHLRYTSDAWSDNHSGPVFIDHESALGPIGEGFGAIARPNDNWAFETSPGYTASVNRWTGKRGGAAQGLWDEVNAKQMFDAATPGVNYVGSANNGSLFYKETDTSNKYYGYYVYNSDEHAASYNQSEDRFYVYNKPQIINSYGEDIPGFLPFNEARDQAYGANNSGEINYHYGMVTEIDFFLTGDVGEEDANQIEINGEQRDMEFYFSGDDDVWVFVDGKLALDIGGIHDRTEGSINFATGEVKTSRTNGIETGKEDITNNEAIANLGAGNHKLTVYYVERGSNQSNNLTAFLLTLPATIKIQKLETQTGEPAVFPGTEFYLQNEEGKFYRLDEDPALANDPLYVPQVSYVDNKSEATKLTADENGVITIKYVVDGKYALTEIGAPDYYEGLPGAFSLEVGNAKIDKGSLKFYADNDYKSDSQPYMDDPDWADKVTVEDDEVTLEVSNDRHDIPLKMKKQFADGIDPAGVKFNVYELLKAPTVDGSSEIDKNAIATDSIPADARLVYEGTTNSSGEVTNYTWYPRGKEQTTDDMKVIGVETAVLKSGSVYYITEDYNNPEYYKIDTPIVLAVDGEKIFMVSDPTDQRFVFDDTPVINWKDATESAPSELDVTNVPVETKPEKKVEGESHYQAQYNEPFTYTIEKKFAANATNVVMTDKLESVLAYVSGSTEVTAAGEELAAGTDYTASFDEGTNTVTITINDDEKVAGKRVVFAFDAKIKPGADLSAYANNCIPNKATITIDGKPQVTNEVTVTPPTPTPDPTGSVIVRYVTEDGTVLENWSDVKRDVPAGTEYTTEQKSFPGYDFVRVDTENYDAPTGSVVANETLEVVYVYRPIPHENPVKKVNNAERAELASLNETFTYTISQTIPGGSSEIKFFDDLKEVLEVVGTPSASEPGFSFSVNANHVEASASGAAAKALAGKTVTFTIQARIIPGTSREALAPYITNGVTQVPNVATVQIDNEGRLTNEVIVEPPTPEEPPAPTGSVIVRYITDTGVTLVDWTDVERDKPEGTSYTTEQLRFDGYSFKEVPSYSADTNGSVVADTTLEVTYVYTRIKEPPTKTVSQTRLTNRDEVFTYTISQRIPANAESVEFADTLENVLEVVGTPELSVEGTVNVNGQAVSASVAKPHELYGEVVSLTIKAKIKDGITDDTLISLYGSTSVPNEARVTIDGNGVPTNRVEVTPPPVGSVIVRYITEDGRVLEDWTDVQRDKPEGTSYTTDQKDFGGYEFVKIDETKDDPSGTVSANVTKEVVYIYKPVVPEEPEKTVSKSQLDARDEVFSYTVSQVIPKDAVNVVFSDTLEGVLEFASEATLSVGGAEVTIDGQTVTTRIADARNLVGQTVTLTFQARIRAGVTDAELIATYGSLDIPNKATVSIDNNPLVTNEVRVTPPSAPTGSVIVRYITEDGTPLEDWTDVVRNVETPASYETIQKSFEGYEFVEVPSYSSAVSGDVEPNKVLEVTYVYKPWDKPSKTVNNAQSYKLAERAETFTYVITQKVPTNAQKMTISDNLEPVLEIVGNAELSVAGTVEVNGNKVSATLADAAACAGQEISLTIRARIKEGITDAQLMALYGTTDVPNTAQVAINDRPAVDTNTVTVTPPPVGSVIVRYITVDGTVLEDWSDVVRDVVTPANYTTVQKEFDGYEFVEVPSYSSAVSGDVEPNKVLEVTYVYKPIEEEPEDPGNPENFRNNIYVLKVDDTTGKAIAGARLQIRDFDGEIVPECEWISTTEPHVLSLKPGTYTLLEVSAPAGYKVAAPITFIVDAKGKATGVQLVNNAIEMRDKPTTTPPDDEPEEPGKPQNPNPSTPTPDNPEPTPTPTTPTTPTTPSNPSYSTARTSAATVAARTAATAKTGDATNLALMGGMVVAGLLVLVAARKVREN